MGSKTPEIVVFVRKNFQKLVTMLCARAVAMAFISTLKKRKPGTIYLKQKKGSTSQLNDEENILTSNSDNTFEVSSLGVQRAILAKVNSLMDMRAKVDSIEESMIFIADIYDSLLAEVMGLRKENGELRTRVEVLEKKEKSSTVRALKVRLRVNRADYGGGRENRSAKFQNFICTGSWSNRKLIVERELNIAVRDGSLESQCFYLVSRATTGPNLQRAYCKEVISNLSSDLADLDQYGRRLNLEIHGLKVVGDPREENLSNVLEKLSNDIGIDYKPEDIHQAHRLQPRRDGKPPTIIVQYYSKTSRDLWLKNGRRAKISDVYFNENLCPQYRQLLREAKLRA
ncbi:hypothetical protein J6590_075707 [Homalodisca vitripennis]|nr:hypothetical protein J6590_075707 [Homalodisca vitripennis]